MPGPRPRDYRSSGHRGGAPSTATKGDTVSAPIIPGAEPLSHTGTRDAGVLVLHGFTGNPGSMRGLADACVAAGFHVEMPRLAGHGTVVDEMIPTRWADWTRDVEDAWQRLASRTDRITVMGLSMGGSLTLRLAENHGDAISGIVLVNPAVHSERPDRHLLPVISKFLGSFPGISNDIKKPGQDEVAYTKIPLKAAHSLSQLWKLVKADINKVTQPLLLLRSEVDHIVEPSNGAWILNHVRSTDKTEIVLKDSYHVATLDNDAPLIHSESAAFVARLTSKN